MTSTSERHLRALPGDPDVPSEANFSAAVRALAGTHKISAQGLAVALGISEATMHRRLAGKGKVGWTMLEMNSVAALFRHSVDDLLRGRVSLHVVPDYTGPGTVQLDAARRDVTGDTAASVDGQLTVTYPQDVPATGQDIETTVSVEAA